MQFRIYINFVKYNSKYNPINKKIMRLYKFQYIIRNFKNKSV
ncbi:unnamed protein product, partial [Vitis vinifera]|uniref:Uncharacterized protein n=1 Tax=Vitis vinifera TaxID=29760 RepID=D7U5U7_VITVI